jgi:putative addiction module component (TIGR02574 family)
MSAQVIELFRKASDLPESDRALLAGLLIESLEAEPDDEVEKAWLDEVERRVEELNSGATKTNPSEEVKMRLIRNSDGK